MVKDLAQQGSAVLDDYLRQYPDLAGQIRELVRLQDAIWDARAEEAPSVPARLGEFRMVRSVARGGMGDVWEAVQERLNNRRVAVKVIRRGRVSPAARERFLREQTVLATLHQTHIVSIHTAGEEGRLQYFAMPFIDGAALHHVVRAVRDDKTAQPASRTPALAVLAGQVMQGGPDAHGPSASGPAPHVDSDAMTDPADTSSPGPGGQRPASEGRVMQPLRLSPEYFRSVAEVMADAAEAVQHAHDAGVVHRDLKPSNIMVDRQGQCWVIDFGLAGFRERPSDTTAVSDPAPVSAEPAPVSGVMGTLHYMAPEQFDSRADVRSDVWGLGATLYELLALERAFDGSTDKEVRARVRTGPADPSRGVVRNVPKDLAAICVKALRKDPAQRYATARELAEDLRRWLRTEPVRARPAWGARRAWLWASRNPGWAAAILLGGLAVTVTLSVIAYTAKVGARRAESEARAVRNEQRVREREARWVRLQGSRAVGWFGDRWEVLRAFYDGAPADDRRVGRDEVAATLVGLDAVPVAAAYLRFDASALAFSPDGRRLLAGGARWPGRETTSTRICDLTAARVEEAFAAEDGPVAFTPDGTPLQLAAEPGRIVLRDLSKGRPVGQFAFPAERPAAEADPKPPVLALARDGALVAAATSQTLTAWEARTGREVCRGAGATALAFAPDHSQLASADGSIITVYPLAHPGKAVTFERSRTKVLCLAFARDPVRPEEGKDGGWLLAAGEAGGFVTVWDVAKRMPRAFCRGSDYDVRALAFSPDATLLATAGRGPPKLWDAATGRLLLTLESGSWVTDVAFSADGRALAISSLSIYDGGGISLYELEDSRGIRTLRGLTAPVERVKLSPDGRLVAAITHDWRIGLWEARTGRLLHVLEAPAGLTADNAAIAFGPGGRFAAAAGREARLWDVATGERLWRWQLPPGLADALAFHASGALLLFRVETEDGKHFPGGAARPEDQPLLCRFRELRASASPILLKESRELDGDEFSSVAPPDGSCFVANVRPWGPGRTRQVVAFDGTTGQTLWKREAALHAGTHLRLDAGGRLLSCDGERAETPYPIVELPGGRLAGSLPEANYGWCARERLWTSPRGWESADGPPGVALFQGDDRAPLVTLVTESVPRSLECVFNEDGTLLVWGNTDGTVHVADLREVRRRLGQLGLGW
jgi:serine/threonine protein kinase/WD40 repeat protein